MRRALHSQVSRVANVVSAIALLSKSKALLNFLDEPLITKNSPNT
jgi:hypothetical protein